VFTITADNATINDVAIDYMKRKLKDKRGSILGGEFLHMRCAAHILNLIVNEGLKGLGDCVSNIRNVVKFVRSSPQIMARFKECIKCEKNSMYEKSVSRCSNKMEFYLLNVECG